MSKKILFVEDQRGFQEAVTKFFRENGFETFSAFDGESGVKIAESEKPDIIFLDVIVPKKDGFEVLKEIKSTPSIAGTPIAILTNLEGVHDVDNALSLGADAYLVKANYSFEDLLKKANEILNKHAHIN